VLKKVTVNEIKSNSEPFFIKTQLVSAFREDGQDLKWEMIKTHESVHIIVFDTDSKEFILVKQVRIPVLTHDISTRGEVYEACAGLVDKNTSIEQIAKEEILEELGYDVDLKNIHFIKTLKSAVGISGRNAYTFYANVTKDNKVSNGGGIETEDIEIVRIHISKIKEFMYSDKTVTDAVTLFLINFYLDITKSDY
jgi:UDP-sugar diphosphatase